jgi:hypothetical protein
MGEGKTMAVVSTNVNVLSATFLFSVLPAGGGGAETESTLTLAENVNVVLPTAVSTLGYIGSPLYYKKLWIHNIQKMDTFCN